MSTGSLAADTPTKGLTDSPARVGRFELALLGLLGLAVLVARRPEDILRAEFSWEEANAFYVPTFFLDPLSQLAETWGGTLQLIPRTGYLMVRAVPVYWAPLAENVLALAALLAMAAFIASKRLAPVVPDRRVRLVLAGLLLLLPAQRHVMGALLNSQWYAGLWLALLPIAAEPLSSRARWLERGVVAAAALTGPFSTLLSPVHLWRLRSARTAQRAWLAAIVVGGGIIQLLVLLASGRGEVTEPRPLELGLATFLLHAGVVPVLGERLSNALGSTVPGTLLFVGGAALIGALGVVGWRALPARALPLVFGAVVIGASGVAVHGGASVWPPGTNERYFLAAATVVVGVIVAGVIGRVRPAGVLAFLLAIGILTDFRLDPNPPQGWERTHTCIGSPDPCEIPIWPPGYEVQWPGAGGSYDMPDHVDP